MIGNYHAVMAGLVLKKEKFYLKLAVKRHVGKVSGVAVTDRYVASCGADERVFLFTNKAEQRLTPAQRAKLQAAGEAVAVRLADLGSLAPPCEVLCLSFTSDSHYLLCGCADGRLLVYRSRDWSLSNSLDVHQKGLLSFAVHPGSGGALVVSVGADRSVAVLDLAKARLLTKWTYTSALPTADPAGEDGTEAQKPAETSGGSAEDAPRKPLKKRVKGEAAAAGHPLARLLTREEPVRVLFSPKGTHFLIQARFSFVVYAASTMEAVRAVRVSQPPQPQDEVHAAVFVDEETVLVGNESAQILWCRLRKRGGTATAAVMGPADDAPLAPVVYCYPEPMKAEAAALLATPLRADVEGRKKTPLRHVSRVKWFCRVGQTLFSLDSCGVLFSWTWQTNKEDGSVSLHYVASANCKGRATSMDVLPL